MNHALRVLYIAFKFQPEPDFAFKFQPEPERAPGTLQLGVPFRDLMILDPLLPTGYPSSIFIRPRALVVRAGGGAPGLHF